MLFAPARLHPPLHPTTAVKETEMAEQSYQVLATGPSIFSPVSPTYSTLDEMQVRDIAPWQYYDLQPSSDIMTLRAEDDLDLSLSAIYGMLLHPDSSLTQGTTMDSTVTSCCPQMSTAHSPGSTGPQMTTSRCDGTLPAATGGDDEGMAALYELLSPGSSLSQETTMMDMDAATAAHLHQMATTANPGSSLPPMATVNSPSSGLPQGTLMVNTSPSSSGLLHGETLTDTTGAQLQAQMVQPVQPVYNLISGLPQWTTVDAAQSPPGAGLPQKATARKRGQQPAMDAEAKRQHRLQKNKEAARSIRQRNKDYVKSLESRLKALEADKKQLLERLQYLEIVCSVRGISPP